MHGIEKVEIVEVIRTTTVVGNGTKVHPIKTVVQYWNKNGRLISEEDQVEIRV